MVRDTLKTAIIVFVFLFRYRVINLSKEKSKRLENKRTIFQNSISPN